jgi:hypothetical protein
VLGHPVRDRRVNVRERDDGVAESGMELELRVFAREGAAVTERPNSVATAIMNP